LPEAASNAPLAAASSHELARGISRGDRECLERFYRLWFDRVFVQARRLTGRDEAFCLDVVQDVMLKVARKLRPMPTEADLERWMARVVRTTALDLLRRESRRAARERRKGGLGPACDPSAVLATAEATEWVKVRTASLSLDDADLLAQRIAREHTLQQIATLNGITPDAAHGRLRRALQKLARGSQEHVL
jgi:RNA polymerase sigma factor (sigma-70 family)